MAPAGARCVRGFAGQDLSPAPRLSLSGGHPPERTAKAHLGARFSRKLLKESGDD